MVIADLHTHSDNSPDGENSVIEMCESAVAHSLSYLAVTDHCEIERYHEDRYERSLRQSYFDMVRARSVFAGQLELLRGLELGNAPADWSLARRVMDARHYDLVLGSLHCLRGREDFAFLNYTVLNAEELMSAYFDEMLEMVSWGGFDVLAHLTYPLRYICGEQMISMDISRYEEKILKIFQLLIEKGKGLEINTSGLRQPYGKTLPDLWCLKLYRQTGGKIVTVGSDAHTTSDVGSGIAEGLRLARLAGFGEYFIYKDRKPVPVPIEI